MANQGVHTGIANVTADGAGNLNVNVQAGGGGGGGGTVTQGPAGTIGTSWFVEVTDGTNVIGTSAHPFRVDPTGTTVQPVSGTLSLNSLPAGANLIGQVEVTDGTNVLFTGAHPGVVSGTLSFPVDTVPATQNVTVIDSASTSTSQANGQSAITGAPTAGSAASFAIASLASITVQVTGTWTGTLASEISFDGGTTWFANGLKQTGSPYVASTFTANFTGDLNGATATTYRVRATAAMTGTATVRVVESINAAAIHITNPLKLQDGTTQSILNTIKAASTAPLATDTALVVSQSPNSSSRIVGNAGVALDAAQNVTAPANELVIGGVYQTTIPALAAGNASQMQLDSTGAQYVNTEGRKATYRASITSFTPVASSTSPSVSIQGSGTKTIRITKIRFSLTCASGSTTEANVILQRFSALTGGTTGSTPSLAKNDTNNAAGTAVVLQYSAVPVTATAVGGITSSDKYALLTASATTTFLIILEYRFGDVPGAQEIVLRGTADYLGLAISGVGTTPLADMMIEWTEE